MAVTSIGNPANAHSTTGSVTGTWGTGQTRTAGNLLAAVVTAGASTAVLATSEGSGTWSKVAEYWNSTTAAGHVLAALWTKTAAGTDAAPVFSSTEAGTAGGMDCMLFELNGANGTILDTSGSYSSSGSGTANGTLTGMTATTGAVAAGGGYAIAVFAQERAAGILTWADAGTGGYFTKLLDGNGVSSRLQTYVGIAAAPASGATLNDAGAFSTNTSAYGAGIVAVFQPAGASGTAGLPTQSPFCVTRPRGARAIAGPSQAAGGIAGPSRRLRPPGSAAACRRWCLLPAAHSRPAPGWGHPGHARAAS